MSMHNEVFCQCPKCGGFGYMQIGQIVSGFDGFDIQNRSALEELTIEQLKQLYEAICEEQFDCRSCYALFNPLTAEKKTKDDVIKQLFGI